jgi:hypothetical protein
MVIDIIGQIFWFGILATPLISFLILRRSRLTPTSVKILIGILLTIAMSTVFYIIAMSILLRDGLGPS